MKNKFQHFVMLLSVCLWTLVGCSDDKSDFDGSDAYFVSFSLTIDGVVYPATLTEGQIVVEVPNSADVSKATPNYQLSENATVLPNPSAVKDWNEDQLFRVESYNNQFNTYTYSLSYTDVANRDNVLLISQADVDAFAQRNINRIDGNLIIGEAVNSISDDKAITNLDGLSNLSQVGYNVVINNSYMGEDLDGLSNLKSVGGFYIGSTAKGVQLSKNLRVELPNLEQIGNLIINSDKITAISLPQVKKASDIYIGSEFLASLELPNLITSHGNIVINGSTAQSNSNKVLNAILLPKLTNVVGNFSLNRFQTLSVLSIDALAEISGNCEIKALRELEFVTFISLKNVHGDFAVTGNTKMTKVMTPELVSVRSIKIDTENMFATPALKDISMPKLQKVTANLALTALACEKIDLPMLENVGEALNVQTARFLQTFNTPKLTACKSIRLSAVNQLTAADFSLVENLEKFEIYAAPLINAIALPKTITGNIVLSSAGQGKELVDLGSLEVVEGSLQIDGFKGENLDIKNIKKIGSAAFTSWNSTLKSISFPMLRECGDFRIVNHDGLKTLAMPVLQEVKSFTFGSCPRLTDMQFPTLKTIKEQLTLESSPWGDPYELTNLNAFVSVTSLGGVKITYASLLADFSGLKNAITGMKAENWSVSDCKYNPTFQNMLDGKFTE